MERLAADVGPIGAIHFEEVRRHVGTDAAHVFGGLLATLTAWVELRGVPYPRLPGRGDAAQRRLTMPCHRRRGWA